MFGNLSTNRQLKTLIDEKCLYIQPFERSSLKQTGYTLNPGRVLRRSEEGEWEVVHTFSTRKATFILKPNEYVVVEPRQSIRISVDGIVGRFVTSSNNVESGFSVVAGQIDSKYGMSGESLRFGLKNLLDIENFLKLETRLVHLEIFDLRGSAADIAQRTTEQEKIWSSRVRDAGWERADSDGPLHTNER